MGSISTSTVPPPTPWEMLNLGFRRDLLEAIFRASDLESLKSFRLVCQLWNKEVLRLLERKAYIQSSKGALTLLYNTLTNCTTPQLYFTSMEIHFTPSNINEVLKEILFKYGKYLKSLRCTGDLNSPFFRRQGDNYLLFPPHDASSRTIFADTYSNILKNWCPNLRAIRIFSSAQLGDFCPATLFGPFQKTVVPRNYFPLEYRLQLTSVELDGYVISTHRQYCISLLIACKQLEKLKISFGLKYVNSKPTWEKDLDIRQFFAALKGHPEITRKLKEFVIQGLKVPQLSELLSDLAFSPFRLKNLGLCGATNISDPDFPQFTTLLDKFSTFPNLEKLVIYKCTCSSCEWRNYRGKVNEWSIEQIMPVMESVKYLEISSSGSFGIGSLSLLLKFPNLQKLEFTLCEIGHENSDYHKDNGEEPVDFDYFFKDWAWLKMTEEYGGVIKKNCSSIKHLTIQHTLNKIESLKCIQECFTSLTKLTIKIRSDVQYIWEVYMEKLSLPSCLEYLSTLPELNDLSVMISKGIKYPKQELARSIKILMAFPELRHFTVAVGSNEDFDKTSFRCSDASSKSIRNLLSDIILDRASYKFRTLAITVFEICCCGKIKDDLKGFRKILSKYKHGYRLNWCCSKSAHIIAKIGNKRYEAVPIMRTSN